MKNFKIAFVLLVALCLIPQCFARSVASDDTGTLGADQWSITADGDLLPNANTYDIGSTSYYPAQICMGGVCKSSWGSVVTPMTDASGYVYPTDSGGVTRLYDAGYIALGAGTAVDVYLLLDSDDDDFYVGRDDTDNDFAIGVGSTLGTDERIVVVDDATATIVQIGDGADSEDKQVTFDGNALDYYLAYDDSEDMLVGGVDATVGTKPAFGLMNEATPLLYVYNGIDGVGAVDIDYGSANITDHTFVSDGGTLILDGTITLTSGEVISNATDDTVRIASNDVATVLEIFADGETNHDATLLLTADKDADAGDRMAIVHDGGTNSMLFQSDTASADTLATILTLAKTGIITTTAAINVDIDDASNSTVTDVLNLVHSTSGTAAAGIGTGLTFDLENGAGTEEEHAYIDAVSTTATNGSEDSDLVIGVMTAGTVAEVLRIDANSSSTTGDQLVITSNTTETDAVTDILVLKTATETAANNYGIGISFQPEDATGSEEVASLDIVETTAARATNDTDFVFSQNVSGTITERVRFDADGSNLVLSGATPAITIGDAGAEDTKVVFDGTAKDYHIGLDDTGGASEDLLTIGVGSALGTTPALTVDGNTDVAVNGTLTTEGAFDLGTLETFGESDDTPDVSDGSYFITHSTTDTITDFDGTGIVAGQIIVVESAGAITYDVTTSGLKGGSTDIVTADGDLTTWIYNGTDWLLISFMDLSDNMS